MWNQIPRPLVVTCLLQQALFEMPTWIRATSWILGWDWELQRSTHKLIRNHIYEKVKFNKIYDIAVSSEKTYFVKEFSYQSRTNIGNKHTRVSFYSSWMIETRYNFEINFLLKIDMFLLLLVLFWEHWSHKAAAFNRGKSPMPRI